MLIFKLFSFYKLSTRSPYPQCEHWATCMSIRTKAFENAWFFDQTNSNGKKFLLQTKETLQRWGLNLSPQLVELDGRVLPAETIIMANNVTFGTGPDVDWTKNLRSNQMLQTVQLTSWLMVYPAKLENQARELFRLLQQTGGSMKFNFPSPAKYVFYYD